ncbi:hydroxyacid dehydrogenase [Candidatus Parcubacteria bacterium]|nr:MAG: hydroxyacid dehydrogenase [Candidatus Parcubacteria bacterium]
MNIAFFEIEDHEKDYFQKHLSEGNNLLFFEEKLNEDFDISKIKDIEIISVFIYSDLKKDILDKLPNLRFIATRSTGYDHIDLEECKKRNILIENVPTYGEYTVAEHTFSLILALSRRIIESYKKVREWNFSPEGLTGFDLNKKTLGVIGVGNIGKNVIKIAKGFGMEVLGHKKNPDPELEKSLDFKLVDLETLLKNSDIITLHIPFSKETRHLLGEKEFEKMKDGVVIINTARGGIIDTNALVKALETGKVRAAGLDVLEEEPLLREEKELLSKSFDKKELLCVLENHLLLSNPNVVITPHNAFNSKEALENITKTTLKNIHEFTGNNFQNQVPQVL